MQYKSSFINNFCTRHICLSILLCTFIIVGTGCGPSYDEKNVMRQARQRELLHQDSLALKITILPTVDCLPIILAADFLSVDSMDIRVIKKQSQMDCDTSLIGGSVEGSISDLVRVAYMQKRGTLLRPFAATNTSWKLISNKLARLKELRQLGDKMVAMTRYSATDYLTSLSLQGVKTSATVFRVQINDIVLRLQMLLNNEMDAMWLPEPFATIARKEGHHVLYDSEKHDVNLGVLVFTEKAYADKGHLKQITAFKKAYDRACDSINTKGLTAYKKEISNLCGIDAAMVDSLPKMIFPHAGSSRESDVEKAVAFVGK